MVAPVMAGDKHLTRIDVLRGVAILMVMAFHFHGAVLNELATNPTADPGWWVWPIYPLHFGNAGVSLFFVISGYVIHRSYLRDPNFTWIKYISRRFWRIYPAYIIVLFIWSYRLHVIGTRSFALHAGLIHNATAEEFFAINASFWSLAVEVQLYVLYPVAILVRHHWGARGMLAVGILASSIWRILAARYYDWPDADSHYIWMSPIALWPDWLLGAYMVERHATGQRVFIRPAWWIGFGLVLLLLAEFFKPVLALQFSIASLISAVVVDVYLHGTSRTRVWHRALIFVGVCSYSLYLIHQPTMGGYVRLLTKLGIHHPVAQVAIGFPPYVLVDLIVAWIMYMTIERGGIRLGSWFSGALRQCIEWSRISRKP